MTIKAQCFCSLGRQRQLRGGLQNQDRILQRQRDRRAEETEGLLLPQCLHSVPLSHRHRFHESHLSSQQLEVLPSPKVFFLI